MMMVVQNGNFLNPANWEQQFFKDLQDDTNLFANQASVASEEYLPHFRASHKALFNFHKNVAERAEDYMTIMKNYRPNEVYPGTALAMSHSQRYENNLNSIRQSGNQEDIGKTTKAYTEIYQMAVDEDFVKADQPQRMDMMKKIIEQYNLREIIGKVLEETKVFELATIFAQFLCQLIGQLKQSKDKEQTFQVAKKVVKRVSEVVMEDRYMLADSFTKRDVILKIVKECRENK